jgi:FtsZ-binding cell division protein ZapB
MTTVSTEFENLWKITQARKAVNDKADHLAEAAIIRGLKDALPPAEYKEALGRLACDYSKAQRLLKFQGQVAELVQQYVERQEAAPNEVGPASQPEEVEPAAATELEPEEVGPASQPEEVEPTTVTIITPEKLEELIGSAFDTVRSLKAFVAAPLEIRQYIAEQITSGKKTKWSKDAVDAEVLKSKEYTEAEQIRAAQERIVSALGRMEAIIDGAVRDTELLMENRSLVNEAVFEKLRKKAVEAAARLFEITQIQ